MIDLEKYTHRVPQQRQIFFFIEAGPGMFYIALLLYLANPPWRFGRKKDGGFSRKDLSDSLHFVGVSIGWGDLMHNVEKGKGGGVASGIEHPKRKA